MEYIGGIVIALILGWFGLNVKDFFSKRKVEKLTDEKIEVHQKIESIPDEVKNSTPDENVDFWNKRDEKK